MLEIENVALAYGARSVLAGVNLELRSGEILGLIGPNGAGKSTLIRATSGVLAPVSGRITIDGKDVCRLPPRERARQIAVVPQAALVPAAMTVRETVLLGRAAHAGWRGRESPADHAAADQALELTNTNGLSKRFLSEISGGERQLVLLARALAQNPRYLLLDEPTAHLDLRHEAIIVGLLRGLARERGLGILAALHDLNLAARHSDRIALVAAGALQALGTPAEVLTEARLTRAYGVSISIHHEPSS